MKVQQKFEGAMVALFFIVFSILFFHIDAQPTNLTYPDPKYVFLLRDEGALLSSVPERNMTAKVRSSLASEKDATWEEDLDFGTVFRCGRDTMSFLEIPDIISDDPSRGFGISFWFKPRDNTTETFSGLISQGAVGSKLSISIDNSTICFGSTSNTCLKPQESPQIQSKGWHHVTLTTYSDDSDLGYQLYVDGVEYGKFPGTGATDRLDGSSIFLCSSGENGTDIFDGSIVDLVVFDQYLQRDEVVTNYNVRNPFRDSINPGMCSDEAIPGILTQTSCAEGFHCYMLSLNDIVELTNTHEYDDMIGRLGLCVPKIYTNLLPSHLLVPTAHVFYPLTSNKLESFPMSLYSGSSQGASIVPDRLFGQTLYCNGTEKEYVALDPVAYGVGGGFTINFWFRPDQMSSEGFSWLFSHGSRDNGEDAFGPNQVQVYLTENGNQSDYGQVSAYVRDSNDQYKGIDSTAILNGDGTIGSLVTKAPKSNQEDDVYDGDWHMVTLTSQVNRDKGYILYVDGKKVNELSPETDVETILGQDFQISGGDMLFMTGNMILCSRGYGDRYPYRGQIAWLSLWEQALMAEQIELLYDSVAQYGVQGSAINPTMEEDVLLEPILVGILQYSKSGKKCVFPSLYESKAVYGCIEIDNVYKCDVGGGVWEECEDGLVDDATVIAKRTEPGNRLDPCLFSETPKDAEKNSGKGCDQGLICIPTNASTEIGVCDLAPSPIAPYHVFNWMYYKGLPQPQVLYPLLDGSYMAITHPQYMAEEQNVGWGWDESFRASVPRCSSALESRIELFADERQDLSIGTTCLWFSARSTSSDTPYKQVLMSTQDELSYNVTLRQAGQQTGYTIHIDMLDSKGNSIPSIDLDTEPFIITDNGWHFACVSADPSDTAGGRFHLSLDGKTVATTQIQPEQIDSQGNLAPGSVLCSSMDGKVSQYMYFDQSLDERQIQSLYSIFQESGILEDTNNTSSGGLSGGAIAGIVIGSIFGAMIIVVLVIMFARHIARSRATSFKRFEENGGSHGPGYSSREFSYEYDREEVSPEKHNYSGYGPGSPKDQVMMSNPVFGLQTPALKSEPHMQDDSEDTSSTASSTAMHPSNSTYIL